MTRGGVFLVLGLVLLAKPAAARADNTCVRVVHALAPAMTPVATDFEPAACAGSNAVRAFRYDAQAGVARSVRELRPGEVISQPPAFALPAVRPGDKLLVHAHFGPVVIEREVEALQAAQPGDRLFVKASDGEVFVVPLAGAQR